MNEIVSVNAAGSRGASRVLLVDDDGVSRSTLARLLTARDACVVEAGSLEEAMRRLESEPFDLVISDQRLPRSSGVELLARVRHTWPAVARVLMSRRDDPEVAWDAINRAGVCYLLKKPWDGHTLDDVLARGERVHAPSVPPREREHLPAGAFPEIVGESAPMQRLFELVRKVARTDSTVLVLGETGTGKELIGRAVHEASARRSRAFSAVNSAAFPESLLESELFGHRRGSFTGATDNSKGLFEQADGGTVFLDEVAEMPLSMQAKLLRFLQTGEIRPVGSGSTHVVDVRLVAATNKPLEQEVRRGVFREDLYYRLAVIPLEVPPLRARLDDVPLLARHFLRRVTERWGRPPLSIDESALDALMAYHWPGNVRELENAIERAVALCPGERVRAEDLPLGGGAALPREATTAPESLPSLERRHILETLERVGWNRKLAAELLQISTTTLWRRLKEFGIDTHTRGRRWVGEPGAS
jgi:DNA-binding NtrC family response regulator